MAARRWLTAARPARDLDWPALLGVGAYFASWQFATLYQGAADYWLALRLYPLGLLLTVALFAGLCFAMIWRKRPASLAAKLVWAVLLVLEINEVWVYSTCKLLLNPLIGPDGTPIGQVEFAQVWGVTVEKAACSRILDFPADLLSWIGAALVLWIVVVAWWPRRAE